MGHQQAIFWHLALMLPLNGWLVERIGAKSLYLWCFSASTRLSSALCGLAWSANSLIAFRILQGMSGGLMAPMTQMMMARAAGKHMARLMGYAAVPILLGPILGPVIAGAILQHALLALALPGQRAGRCIGNRPGGSLSAQRSRRDSGQENSIFLASALLSPGLVLFLYGSTDHLGEHTGLTTSSGFPSFCLPPSSGWPSFLKRGQGAHRSSQLFKRKTFSASRHHAVHVERNSRSRAKC